VEPPVRRLFQHAYLVNDLEASAQRWHDLLGAGPFFVARHHRTERFLYRGEPVEADVSYGFAYLGDLMIQLIEQHDEVASIYREMYPPGAEGFHHVGTLVPVADFQATKARFVAQGFPVACELYADGVDAAYLDTRPVTGGFTEIHGDPEHILATFAHWRRAHETWDGSGPLIRG
jgi:hypothetical protein